MTISGSEVEYLGSATSPLGNIVTTTKANLLAANAAVASDGSTWNVAHTSFDGPLSGSVVLSNGNLTATKTVSAGNSMVISTAFLVFPGSYTLRLRKDKNLVARLITLECY